MEEKTIAYEQPIEDTLSNPLNSFQRGRKLVYIANNSPSYKGEFLDLMSAGRLIAYFMEVIDIGKSKYDSRNPTKKFDKGVTLENAEILGRTWQSMLELGWSYKKLNKLSWKELAEKAEIFQIVLL